MLLIKAYRPYKTMLYHKKQEEIFMKKLILVIFVMAIFFVLMCDKYNIVESRYYDDLVEFPIYQPEDNSNDGGIGYSHIPTGIALDPYWNSALKDSLLIFLENPHQGEAVLEILKWNGSVFETLVEDQLSAGTYIYTYDAAKLDKIIYGISYQFDSWHEILWFEMK